MDIKSLYKFMPCRSKGDCFFDNFLIRLSSRNSMNDPFEVLPSEESLYNFLRTYAHGALGNTKEEITNSTLFKNTISNTTTGKQIDIFNKTGAICLTETKRNLLMWSHYADSHKGFVIELNTTHPFFHRPEADNNYHGRIHRVIYDRERPKHINNWSDWFTFKSDEWIYEKEHRFLFSLYLSDECYKNENNVKQAINPRKTQEIYKNNYICLMKIPKDVIISVSFGAKTSPENKQRIVSTIKDNPDLAHIKMYESKICTERYDLIFDGIY